MRIPLAITLLLATAPVFADEAAPAAPAAAQAEPAKTRAPLKLRLDEAPAAAPRITFEPREHTSTATPPEVLPALGGRTSPAFEQKAPPGTKSSPFPADTNPNH